MANYSLSLSRCQLKSKFNKQGLPVINNSHDRGFTIVELLVVIVVIGILAAITIVSYTGIAQRANVAAMQSDLSSISQRLKMYYTLYSSYPTALDGNNCPTAPNADSNYCLKLSGSNTLSYNGSATTFSAVEANSAGTTYYKVTDNSSPVAVNSMGYGMVSYYSAEDTGNTVADVYSANNGIIKVNATAYYPFDGNANDASTSNKNGTVSGATLTTDRFGNANSAYSFNGSNNHIATSSISFGSNKRFYSAWVKIASTGANTVIDGALQFKVTSSNKLRVQWSDSGWHTVDSTSAISTGVWTHVALAYDGSIAKFYINGVADATTASISAYAGYSPASITIGRDGGGGSEVFNGSIDEVLIGQTSGNNPTDGDIAKLYTLTNAHDMNKPSVTGRVNKGFDLWGYASWANDSTCSYIDMGTGFNQAVHGVATPFTISYWMYRSSGSSSASEKNIGWYGGNYKGVLMGVYNDGNIGVTIGQGNTTGSSSNFGFSAGSAPLDQWDHIVLTYDGTNIKVYVNGSNTYTHNIGAFVDNGDGTQPLKINLSSWSLFEGSRGRYDEIGLWSRAITQAEVTTIYNSGSGLQYP